MAEPKIMPSTSESLETLSKIQGDDRCVLSIYFPGSKAKRMEVAVDLIDLPEDVFPVKALIGDEEEHFKRTVDVWRKAVYDINLPPAQGWLAVVSWLTDEAVFMQLPDAAGPAVYLDNSPFLLPAARLLDDLEAYAVVYADHARATIFLAALGRIEEEGRLRGDIKNHVRKGGWSQQRYERRRDKEISRYCKALVDRLGELIRDEGLRRVILAGDRLLIQKLEGSMPADMQRLVGCRLPMEDRKTPAEIFEETLSSAAAEEKREERRLRDAIKGEHAAGGRATVGPEATLQALRQKRVHRLLIGPMADVMLHRCRGCGALRLGEEGKCAQCNELTYAQPAANEFMDLAFAAGSNVELTNDKLEDIEGVGAILRW
jgi:peptide chain release factor subunit 1